MATYDEQGRLIKRPGIVTPTENIIARPKNITRRPVPGEPATFAGVGNILKGAAESTGQVIGGELADIDERFGMLPSTGVLPGTVYQSDVDTRTGRSAVNPSVTPDISPEGAAEIRRSALAQQAQDVARRSQLPAQITRGTGIIGGTGPALGVEVTPPTRPRRGEQDVSPAQAGGDLFSELPVGRQEQRRADAQRIQTQRMQNIADFESGKFSGKVGPSFGGLGAQGTLPEGTTPARFGGNISDFRKGQLENELLKIQRGAETDTDRLASQERIARLNVGQRERQAELGAAQAQARTAADLAKARLKEERETKPPTLQEQIEEREQVQSYAGSFNVGGVFDPETGKDVYNLSRIYGLPLSTTESLLAEEITAAQAGDAEVNISENREQIIKRLTQRVANESAR